MKLLLLNLTAVLLLFSGLCGCKAFRETFSRTPDSMKRTPRRAAAKPARRPGETGDKLFDTVFHRGKTEKKSPVLSESLNSNERRLVEQSFSSTPRNANDDADIRRIRERNNRSQIRQRDEVFGTHNGSFF